MAWPTDPIVPDQDDAEWPYATTGFGIEAGGGGGEPDPPAEGTGHPR